MKWKHFPCYWPVTRSSDVFFDLRLNKRWSKQSGRRWFETPFSRYDVAVIVIAYATPIICSAWIKHLKQIGSMEPTIVFQNLYNIYIYISNIKHFLKYIHMLLILSALHTGTLWVLWLDRRVCFRRIKNVWYIYIYPLYCRYYINTNHIQNGSEHGSMWSNFHNLFITHSCYDLHAGLFNLCK